MDDKAKKAFLAMPLDEQLLAILDSQQYIRGKIAQLEKRQIDFEEDVRSYRLSREAEERKLDQTQRIIKGVVSALKRNKNAQ